MSRAGLLWLGLLGVFASPAAAATVTLGSDSPNTFDAMCFCFVPSVPGELRYEIYNAGPGDTVEIAPGVNVTLSQGHILVDKNLNIEGQGADATAVSVPASNSRIFKIGSVTPAAAVTIRDLAMTGGRAQSGAAGTSNPGDGGGAIHTSAELTLDRVAFVNNRAGDGGSGATGANGSPSGSPGDPGGPGGLGGAVFNLVGGALTVTDSTFESNFAGDGGTGGQGGDTTAMFGGAGAGGTGGAGQDGGAIHNAGAMTVTNSTFIDNRSGGGGTGGDRGTGLGGAGGAGGAGGDGGAIHQAGAGSVTISNSTIAGNVADLGGDGGMGFAGPAASGAGGVGGGTYFFIPATVANSLYSLNTAVSGSNCAGGGTITSQGANLSFPSGGCPGSFSNGDPQLADSADNGGPTRTMALGPGSAAINQVAVGSPNCPGADQRGVARPQGPTCDIGAFELEMDADPEPPTPPPTPRKCGGKPATLTGTLSRDRLTGTAAADVIAGFGGNDVLKGLGGKDVICGGPGNDRLIGGGGRDRLLGQGGRDRLVGGPRRDRCVSGPGRDRQRSC